MVKFGSMGEWVMNPKLTLIIIHHMVKKHWLNIAYLSWIMNFSGDIPCLGGIVLSHWLIIATLR